MASIARLEHLHKLVQPDLEALPDRSVSPELEPDSDSDAAGGVTLDLEGGPPKLPCAASASKQSPPEAAAHTTNGDASTNTGPSPFAEENTDRRFVWIQGAASSYNLGSMAKIPAPATTKLPPITLKRGDLVPAREHFTPIHALAKYPYKFCNKTYMQDIASAFFDAGKFWAREWDLYYVWDVEEIGPVKPTVLVREKQVEDLIKEINLGLRLTLKITNEQREEGLVSRFPDHPRCLPRYLGRSHSKEEFEDMVDHAPAAGFRASGEPMPPSLEGRTLEDFKQMMEELWDLQKAKGKAHKQKKQQERLVKQKVMADHLKRTQRYLGLRPAQTNTGLPPAVDPSQPTHLPFERSVVFVCVDVESYERAHHKITEVGIASLDTRELIGIAPGKDGEIWRSKIRARHFRVEEHKHLVNSEFITGCPERFEFGKSEWVRLDEVAEQVGACFKPPFCARPEEGAEDAFVAMINSLDLDEKRGIILLGHDTVMDIKYLQSLGYDPLDPNTLPQLIESLDTATMYRVWRREQQATNLGKILYDFDIAGWNLHNAGNDAVYTIQAMLGICVREATIRGSSAMEEFRNADKAARLANAQKEAQDRAQDEAAGWSDNEVEGDGGDPVTTVIKEAPRPLLSPDHARNANMRMRTQEAVSFDLSSPTRDRGRGRGRGGGSSSGFRDNGTHRNSYNSSSTSERGGLFRSAGRPRVNNRSTTERRGRGGGRGRGHARDSFNSDSRPSTSGGFARPEPQVKYHW